MLQGMAVQDEVMQADDSLLLPVDVSLCTGVDVGGTKVAILDTSSSYIHRYKTGEYHGVEDVLDDYFVKIGKRPRSIALVMAGPRDDETGNIKLTLADWQEFRPDDAAKKYPGTAFVTANDMIGAASGILSEQSDELLPLKQGTMTGTGTKLIISVSTGLGVAAAVWDHHSKRYVFMASEGGHIGIQPQNDDETEYLHFLQAKYPRASAEFALSGKAGINNIIDHTLVTHTAERLKTTIEYARASGQPVGAVLREFAIEGSDFDQEVARKILNRIGGMLGATLRDLAVAFKATGGVYLTGSVSLSLGEYLTQETELINRFVHAGAKHHIWVEEIPIYLATDPHVTVRGALELAKQ